MPLTNRSMTNTAVISTWRIPGLVGEAACHCKPHDLSLNLSDDDDASVSAPAAASAHAVPVHIVILCFQFLHYHNSILYV